MSNVAIRVEGLGKKYRLGASSGSRQSYNTLQESLIHAAKAPLRVASRLTGRTAAEGERGHRPEFWALKDVEFEVKHGEVLGIIGRNGAGKSTLLKLLSHITEPTTGFIGVNGRVASLLEVGTGFHPELTGRENVYLNGAILGMARAEIARKFDEIVAFAEVEQFIDSPVKHYSSGMYLRLAFAVAAHLEPDILIVDEVLAVGDFAFQKKCLGRMEQVAQEGRTVLFVSHNMVAIAGLCQRGILMEGGQISYEGSSQDTIRAYVRKTAESMARGTAAFDPPRSVAFSLVSVSTCDGKDNATAVLSRSEPITVRLRGEVFMPREDLLIAVDVRAPDDTLLFRTHNIEQQGSSEALRRRGPFTVDCIIPSNLLPAGTYRVGVVTALAGKEEIQNLYPALEFDVVQDQLLGDRFSGTRGILTPQCSWKLVGNAH